MSSRPANLTRLRRAYDEAAEYVGWLERENVTADVSEFWAEIFADPKRRSFPEFDDMLVMRRGFTYPMAERARVEDKAAERAYADGAWHVAGLSIGEQARSHIEESPFGCPTTFVFGEQTLSAAGIVNGTTTERVVRALDAAGLSGRPLRVLEIGAGFGQMAQQLMSRVDVERYAVCDLAHNLFLNAFYLQANFPGRSTRFVRRGDSARAELEFVAAGMIEELQGPWDLIVNAYSFQEMTLGSVQEYFAYAREQLAPDGLLYSLNSHGKSGVERPSDYPLEGFVALERPIAPRRLTFQAFATVPYELRLRPAAGAPQPGADAALDGLGIAMQLGLDDELASLGDAWRAGGAHPATEPLLSALTGSPTERRPALEALEAALPGPVAPYLRGTLAFALDEPCAADLRAALPELISPQARMRAHLLLACDGDETQLTAASTIAPHLETELGIWAGDPEGTAELIASQVGVSLAGWPSLRRRGRSRLRRIAG